MDLKILSDDGLRSLHAGVAKALKTDDETPPGQERMFGAREYSDWRKWGDALEEEMTRRSLSFSSIGWDNGNA